MPFNFEPLDIIIIMVVAIILFGPSRLPEIGHGLGKAIGEFRKGRFCNHCGAEFADDSVQSA